MLRKEAVRSFYILANLNIWMECFEWLLFAQWGMNNMKSSSMREEK